MICPLCENSKFQEISYINNKKYFKCDNCFLISIAKEFHLTAIEEQKRYSYHKNSINDQNYVEFLNQAVEPTLKYLNTNMIGLDFGCGPCPTLSKILKAKNLNCTDYDLYFYPEFLNKKFDFIFSTECFEHFRKPKQEIEKILSILKKQGILTIMTSMWDNIDNFKDWYYIKDPTHISFYHKNTFRFIAKRYNLEILEITDKVVILKFV